MCLRCVPLLPAHSGICEFKPVFSQCCPSCKHLYFHTHFSTNTYTSTEFHRGRRWLQCSRLYPLPEMVPICSYKHLQSCWRFLGKHPLLHRERCVWRHQSVCNIKSLLVQILQQDFSSFVVAEAAELWFDGLQSLLHLCRHRLVTAVQEAATKHRQRF